MWPLLIAGAALGTLKGVKGMVDESKDRKLQAETTRYSPWTGMKAADPRRANLFGDLLSGGLTGAMIGQGIQGSGIFGGGGALGAPMSGNTYTPGSDWGKFMV